ncbi:hypothetical protein [Massilia soli]|uniref:Uncharacterized protein n=1 Tax=Massilia soli TaxID=2792854 RepID=A0ABS7SLZ4_9BURK|nr:hypothetical protein [Massilia soli]MBZ2207203.1 hypothetical protein [Massilia soli]
MAFKHGHDSTAGLIKAYVLCKAEAGELPEAIPERGGDDAMARRCRSL